MVEKGSIAEAARLEHLTAAAVSQRIQTLERTLGIALLIRTGHTVKASEACLALLPRARHIVQSMALLANDADSSGLLGPLRVGTISTALTGLLPSVLRQLVITAPQAKPLILPGTSRELYAALLNDELDAIIVVAPPFELHASLRRVDLRKEPLVLLTNAKPHLSIRNVLQTEPYIRYDPNAWGDASQSTISKIKPLRLGLCLIWTGLRLLRAWFRTGWGLVLSPTGRGWRA
ncbi:LysR family transcriptional regulator [Pseudomonas congelans]|uniref:LysR family transcriptional regulator n=1 Tax=Pseudomonas congelans TaxID=200452 RepID=UPI002027E9CF|nr:LysR substrate-binding domain-containing protein [Pseudomonas congelans]